MIPSGRLSTTPSWAVISVRAAPADLEHRADDRVAFEQREVVVDLGDQLGRVADRVVGEQQRVDDPGAQRHGERFGVHRPVEGDQAADADERESEPERDAGERGREAGEERPAVGIAGQLGVDDDDGVDADADEVEGQAAGVAADLGLDVDEPAAAHGLRGDREGDAARWYEADRQVSEAEVRHRRRIEVERRLETEAFDGGGERADDRAEVRSRRQGDDAVVGGDADGQPAHRDRPDRERGGKADFQAGVAAESQAAGQRPFQGGVEGDVDGDGGEDRGEERVAVAAGDVDEPTPARRCRR